MITGNQLFGRCLAGLAFAYALLVSGISAAQSVDPDADKVLRSMSSYIASVQEFSIEAETTLESLVQSGQKLMFIKQLQVAVKQPDKMRVARQGMLQDQEMFFDGKSFTLLGKRTGLYATVPAGPTIKAVMDFVHDELDLEVPGADLFSNDSYNVLMSDVITGEYVGITIVDGVPCYHLAYRGDETDWQIWVEAGHRPLPRKYVVTSRWITGAPQYTMEIHNWILNPGVPDSTFQFTPPEGSAEIEFLAVIDQPNSN